MSEALAIVPLKWISEKVLDLLADRLEKRILKEINPEIAQIQEELGEIRNTQEQMLVAPLMEGVRRLEHKQFEKAIDNLIEAEAKNPYASVPKYWLALALSRHDKDRNQALSRLSEAIRRNPYSVLAESNELIFQAQSLILAAKDTSDLARRWSLSLGEMELNVGLAKRFKWPKRILQRYLGMYSTRSTAAIVKASTCGGHLAVQWLLANNLRHDAEEVVALFSLKSWEPVWARLNKKEDLIFLTYENVVVRSRERNLYCLLDLTSGAPVKRMSQGYFQTMFGSFNQKSAVWLSSNWHGTAPAEAYEKSARFMEPRVTLMDTTFGHFPSLFSEGSTLHDPCSVTTQSVSVSNRWTHFHFSGGATLLPSCRLDGGAMIRSGSILATKTIDGEIESESRIHD